MAEKLSRCLNSWLSGWMEFGSKSEGSKDIFGAWVDKGVKGSREKEAERGGGRVSKSDGCIREVGSKWHCVERITT